jgi:copper chaperone NosL
MKKSLRAALLVAAVTTMGACRQEVAQDIAPREMTAETLGHYCQMNLLEHPGPKAQVFMQGYASPLFFSQVRDAIAYTRAPEQVAPILAVYVNDMGASGATWELPGEGNWIAADAAFYVLGSAVEGGMGAPEAVPFSSRESAEAFVLAEGGHVLELAEIADDTVLAPVEDVADSDEDDAAFNERLHALHKKAGE